MQPHGPFLRADLEVKHPRTSRVHVAHRGLRKQERCSQHFANVEPKGSSSEPSPPPSPPSRLLEQPVQRQLIVVCSTKGLDSQIGALTGQQRVAAAGGSPLMPWQGHDAAATTIAARVARAPVVLSGSFLARSAAASKSSCIASGRSGGQAGRSPPAAAIAAMPAAAVAERQGGRRGSRG